MVTESGCKRLPGAQEWGQGEFLRGRFIPVSPFLCPHREFAMASNYTDSIRTPQRKPLMNLKKAVGTTDFTEDTDEAKVALQ